MKRVAAAVALVVLASGAGAEIAPVYPSAATCQQWTSAADGVSSDKRAIQDTAYNYWIGGFLDGGAFTAGLAPPEALERGAFVTDLFHYCEAHPAELLPAAARVVIQRSWARRR